MPGLDDLYREIILDHYRTPRNRGELETPPAIESPAATTRCAATRSPCTCCVDGDGDDAIVTDVKIGGQGCSISQSSASMMTQAVKGKPVGEAKALIRRFKTMMSIEGLRAQPGDDDIALGDLEALQGVVKFPVRIKCAVLGWNTLADALDRADA